MTCRVDDAEPPLVLSQVRLIHVFHGDDGRRDVLKSCEEKTPSNRTRSKIYRGMMHNFDHSPSIDMNKTGNCGWP